MYSIRSPVAIHFAFALKNYVRQQWSAATSFLYKHLFFFGFSFFIICSVHYHSYSWPLLAYFFLLAFWLISICKPKKWACIVCCAQTFFVGGWFFVIFSNFWPKTIKYPLLRVSKRQLYCAFEQRAYFFS